MDHGWIAISHSCSSPQHAAPREKPSRANSAPWTRQLIILLMLLFGSQVAALLNAQTPTGQTPLQFRGDNKYPPLEYLDEGIPKGLNIDIAAALGNVLQQPINIKLIEWADAQEEILTGKADALLVMTITPERQALYEFTSTTIDITFGLFVRSDELAIHSINDLSTKKVGLASAGFPSQYLSAQPIGERIIINDYVDGFNRLLNGEIDAVAADLWVGSYQLQAENIEGIKLAGEPFVTRPAAMAVRKGNTQLLATLNQGLAQLEQSGDLAAIRQRWSGQETLFMTRDSLAQLLRRITVPAVIIVLILLTLWVITLKKQIRDRHQAEAALAEGEERLRMALEASDLGTWRWDVRDNQDTRDAGLNRILGLTAEASTQSVNDFIDRVVEADRPAIQAALDKTSATGVPYLEELRIKRPDGTVRWLRDSGKAIFDDKGQVTHITGAVVDITDRIEAELALRNSEARLRSFSDLSFEGIAIHENGTLLEANDRFCKMFGYQPNNILNQQKAPEKFPSSFLIELEKHLKANSNELYETEAIRSDGTRFPIEVRTTTTTYQDRPVRVALVLDVAERQRAQEALFENQEILNGILDNSSAIIFIKDLQGRYLLVNHRFEEIFNVTRKWICGRTDYELFDQEIADAFRVNDQKVIESGKPIQTEEQAPHPDGLHISIVQKFPFFDANGQAHAVCGIATDITERERVARTLQKNEMLLSEMGELAKMGGWEMDVETTIVQWTEGIFRIFELPEEEAPPLDEIMSYFPIEDRNILNSEMDRCIEDGTSFDLELRFNTATGIKLWTRAIGRAQSQNGKVIRLFGTFQNITAQKEAEQAIIDRAEQERRLLLELDHRVRNNMSSLIALIDLTAQTAGSTYDFANSIRSRVRTMAMVHGLLAETRWSATELNRMLAVIIPNEMQSRVSLEGPEVRIPLAQAQALGLVLNELITNSMKYGAMNVPTGQVNVTWRCAQAEQQSGQQLIIHWHEKGGPTIAMPPAENTGTGLIKGLIRSELHGTVDLQYPPQGAQHRLHILLDESGTAQFGQVPKSLSNQD